MNISVVSWFMGRVRICAGPDTGKNGALYGKRAYSRVDRPMSCLSPWPTRRLGWSGRCSAAGKRSEPKRAPPRSTEQKKSYCEGDDDVMAKQGDRGRPNPRCCPSIKLDPLTGRRSTDSIRARSQQYAASRGRIDDCKANQPLSIKTLAIRGASIDDTALLPFFRRLRPGKDELIGR